MHHLLILIYIISPDAMALYVESTASGYQQQAMQAAAAVPQQPQQFGAPQPDPAAQGVNMAVPQQAPYSYAVPAGRPMAATEPEKSNNKEIENDKDKEKAKQEGM